MTKAEVEKRGYVFYPDIIEEDQCPYYPGYDLLTMHVKKNGLGEYVGVVQRMTFLDTPYKEDKNLNMMRFKLYALEMQAKYVPPNYCVSFINEVVITDWKEPKRGIEE